MSDVTRLRRSALRWAESLLKCRYLVRPPAIVAVRGRASFHVWSRECRSVGFGAGVEAVCYISFRPEYEVSVQRCGCIVSSSLPSYRRAWMSW
jgi:hypothetical protein